MRTMGHSKEWFCRRNSPDSHCNLHVQMQSREFIRLRRLSDFNSAVPHFAYLPVSTIDNSSDSRLNFGRLKLECTAGRPFCHCIGCYMRVSPIFKHNNQLQFVQSGVEKKQHPSARNRGFGKQQKAGSAKCGETDLQTRHHNRNGNHAEPVVQ